MRALPLALVLSCAVGCVVDDEPAPEPELASVESEATGCGVGYDATGVYTPYPGSATYPTGSTAEHPWPGEDFEAYGPATPFRVECASSKSLRGHLEVTAGCLDAVEIAGAYRRG